MQLIDRILVILAILIISISIVYLIYFYGSDDMFNIFTLLIGTAGFLLALFEFLRKK